MTNRCFQLVTLAGCCWLLLDVAAAAASPREVDKTSATVDFERDVASVLVRRCVECHQPGNTSGGLNLTSASGMNAGGDSASVIDRQQPDDSYLLQRVHSAEMPPPSRGLPQPLPAEEATALQRWIHDGADWPEGRVLELYERTTDLRAGRDFWSLQPLRDVQIPQAVHPSGSRNPIDAFVMERLQSEQMVPAPPAVPAVLLQRMTVDTTGLKPEATVIEAFAADASMTAVQQHVDAFLASPQFGQRWARHWLDVVRYAETSGYERDQPKPFAWRYRDWVVDALNQDMPYDQFIREQLAGDELEHRSRSSVIATGFLRLGTWNDEPNDPEDYVYERLEDLVHVSSTAFLGLTVKCARCHDHKFDPIPQVDYYRMASAFWPGPIHARDRSLLGGPTAEELHETDVLGWTDITTQPEPLHVLKNGERHHPLEAVAPATLSFRPQTFREFTPNDGSQQSTGRRRQLADWIASADNPLTARVIVNRIWRHYFGQGLVRSPDNFGFTGDRPTHPELLDWLAGELIRNHWRMKSIHRLILTSVTYQQSSQHPQQQAYNLRDAANQLLWKANARRLDAETLRDAILQASGQLNLAAEGPGFFPTVSAEALEGLSRKDAAWTASTEEEQRRRSLYMFSQRSLLPPLMTTFDLCDTTLPCGQRDVSIVAPQALTLLNNPFVHQQAEHLAVRVLQESQSAKASSTAAATAAIWRAILKRDPAPHEHTLAERHVKRQLQQLQQLDRLPVSSSGTQSPPSRTAEQLAWASLCLVLMNSNEFMFVD